jgi:hypothetical protein
VVQVRDVVRIALATALILLIPLLAMQFTDEVVWSLTDFTVAGALLSGTGFAYLLLSRRADTTLYRAAVGIALAAALLLVWANLAVGIIGSEDNPANLMYFGVLGVLVIGAAIAQLEPQGMARALFATALAQALVPGIAFLLSTPRAASLQVLGVTALFIMLFVLSGLLFRRASVTGS